MFSGILDANVLDNFTLDGPGGSNIKSLQQISISITTGSTTATASITPIDTSKAIVLRGTSQATTDNIASRVAVRAKITSASQIAFYTHADVSPGESLSHTCYVAEYSKIKSMQVVEWTQTADSTTQTIAAVNTSKTFVSLTYSSTNGVNFDVTAYLRAYINSSTQLVCDMRSELDAATITAYVLEFM